MDQTKEEEFEEKLESIMREDVDDLSKTAGILASWMSDQKYTIAEQLTILEIIRATVVASYMTGVVREEIKKQRAKLRQSAVTGTFSGVQN